MTTGLPKVSVRSRPAKGLTRSNKARLLSQAVMRLLRLKRVGMGELARAFLRAVRVRPVVSSRKLSRVVSPLASSCSSSARATSLSCSREPKRPSTDFGGTTGGVIAQTLVDVADLLDVQGAEGETALLGRSATRHFDLQELQGFEQVQHGAVVDQERLGGRLLPGGARGACPS